MVLFKFIVKLLIKLIDNYIIITYLRHYYTYIMLVAGSQTISLSSAGP